MMTFKCSECGDDLLACIEIKVDLKRVEKENEPILDTIRAEYCQHCAVSIMEQIKSIIQEPTN